jgi:hypothetical protein
MSMWAEEKEMQVIRIISRIGSGKPGSVTRRDRTSIWILVKKLLKESLELSCARSSQRAMIPIIVECCS